MFTATQWLLSLHKLGIKFGLENMRTMCAELKHPETKFPSVHIAGTNGKGSTAAFLESILRASGIRTGLTTSPHLASLRERIQVGGAPISAAELRRGTLRLKRALDGYNGAHEPLAPTFFEATMLLAFDHFARKSVEMAVVETGLGGRLDASNVLLPRLSLITNIDLEHTDMLGHSLPEIAREKGGIIKPNVPLLSAATQPEVRAVLREIARERGVVVSFIGDDFSLTPDADGAFTYRGQGVQWSGLTLGLRGAHQLANAALAIAAACELRAQGFAISEAAVRRGLCGARWPGRLEWRDGRPPWLIDCAHNPAGVATLLDHLRREHAGKRLLVIFAAMKDKEYATMLSALDELDADWLFTAPPVPRAESAATLARCMPAREGRRIRHAATHARALRLAATLERDYDLVVLTGSIYFVGAAYRFLDRHRPR